MKKNKKHLSSLVQEQGESSTDSLSESPEYARESQRIPDSSNGNLGGPSTKQASTIQQFRQICFDVVNNDIVQTGIICLILVNSIMMGVGTFEFDTTTRNAFELTDRVFLIIFTVELLLQVIGRGIMGVLRDGWLCFDTVVIIASWSLEQLQVARAFRVFRTLRLATRLESLRSLVQALARVAPSVSGICALLLLVMYIYGVMCTVLFSDLYEQDLVDDTYFSQLDKSLFTLFQFITLENWSEIVRQVTDVYYGAWFLFISYLIISAFLLYSLIIGVVCDAVAMDNSTDDDISDSAAMALMQHYAQRIEDLHCNQQQILEFCQTCTARLEQQKQTQQMADDRSVSSNRSSVFTYFFGKKEEATAKPGVPKVQFKELDKSSSEDEPDSNNQSMAPFFLYLRKFRDLCGKMVNDSRVQLFIIALIIVNAIMMGVATFPFVTDSPRMAGIFEKIDFVFLIIFTVELSFQLIYRGIGGLFTDGWLCFDAIVVASSWGLDNFQIIRALRVFRAARIISRLETLKTIVQALIDVAPSVGGIVALLSLILYIFAVMCTVFFGDLYENGLTDENYFGTLLKSLFTLFQCVTLSFSDVARQVAVEYWWAKAFFVVFVILTSFILFSLVVAVVCDAVMTGERSERVGEKELLARVTQLKNKADNLARKQARLLESANEVLQILNVPVNYKLGMTRTSSALSGCSSAGSVLQEEEWVGNFVCPNLSESMDEEESVMTNQTSLSLKIKRRVKRDSSSGPKSRYF